MGEIANMYLEYRLLRKMEEKGIFVGTLYIERNLKCP